MKTATPTFFWLTYLNPICPSIFIKTIFLNFHLWKKILTFLKKALWRPRTGDFTTYTVLSFEASLTNNKWRQPPQFFFGLYKPYMPINFYFNHFFKWSIFQTFWRLYCCAKFLFFELETSKFGSSYVFLSPLKWRGQDLPNLTFWMPKLSFFLARKNMALAKIWSL